MQIQILAVNKQQAMTSTGKPYDKLDIAYKNLTFGGKVEGKLVMPFGTTAPAHKILSNAQGGQVYDINVVKNDKGYNDWTTATLSNGAPPQQEQTTPSYAPRQNQATGANAPRTSTYETPEERAKKQVYIVRQSSISAAVASLSVGSKSALKPSDVVAVAREYEAYVFDTAVKQDDFGSGFDDMNDDVPL
jgi:hypothetical protein